VRLDLDRVRDRVADRRCPDDGFVERLQGRFVGVTCRSRSPFTSISSERNTIPWAAAAAV